MKKTGIILCLFCFALNFSFAQQDRLAAQNASDKLTAMYNLTPAQKTEMLKIQIQRQRNLEEIEAFKTTDAALYAEKLKSTNYGADMSVRRMLDKEQLKIYKQRQIEKRTKRTSLLSNMTKSGASKAEIQAAMQALELEY